MFSLSVSVSLSLSLSLPLLRIHISFFPFSFFLLLVFLDAMLSFIEINTVEKERGFYTRLVTLLDRTKRLSTPKENARDFVS